MASNYRSMIKVKLFKPGYSNSNLNDFLSTHEILRIQAYPHARKAGIGNYVGVTYRGKDSDGGSIGNPSTCGHQMEYPSLAKETRS